MPSFSCESCSKAFNVTPATLAKFPGWKPKTCFNCKKSTSTNGSKEENLTTAEVLEKYSGGPINGVFTDGSSEPNPGPGGWGAVYVENDKIISEDYGHEPHTTNNRMELTALIAACKMVPRDKKATVYTDSQLCVNTINIWAKDWEKRNWKKKKGEIKNLELVQELYQLFHNHPGLKLEWIKAHNGNKWNEYADSLATAYRRKIK